MTVSLITASTPWHGLLSCPILHQDNTRKNVGTHKPRLIYPLITINVNIKCCSVMVMLLMNGPCVHRADLQMSREVPTLSAELCAQRFVAPDTRWGGSVRSSVGYCGNGNRWVIVFSMQIKTEFLLKCEYHLVQTGRQQF